MKEVKQHDISTGVKNLWKEISALKRHALEFLPAQERVFCAPVVPRSPFRFAVPRSTASKLEGFSRTVICGASEKCAKPSTNVHTAFTTFPQARELCKCRRKGKENAEIQREREVILNEVHRNSAIEAEENSGNFSVFPIGPMKFVHAKRVRAD
jgi:hypothetical protein